VGSYYATDGFGWFGIGNLAIGAVALTVALASGLRRLGRTGGAASRRVVARGIGLTLAALALAVGAERLATWSQIQFDWTFEQAFEPSRATLDALASFPNGVDATLFFDPNDPRVRRTRLLLERIAQAGPLRVRDQILDENAEDVDRFEVGSSNTVVLRQGDRFETIERPTEGTLYEALYHLRSVDGGNITVLRGDGEGDFGRMDDLGFAGLAAALATEGYHVDSLISATMDDVPDDTNVLLVVAPQRQMRDDAVAAIRRYLDRGGRLVALLEPGATSGVEAVLEEYGITSPDALVVDPMRNRDHADASALNPVASAFWDHPITRGLDANRMTYFPGARSFRLRKPRVDDELSNAVDSSPYAWLEEDTSLAGRRSHRFERGSREAGYQPLVVTGRYMRGNRETRIVAFGDADFASNQHLRTLYNLDLILNAIHWAAENEPLITQRPKNRPAPVQFPIPLTNTLKSLYGVGLLVPELLLLAGGVTWLRRHNA
jgi:hypothetical protein